MADEYEIDHTMMERFGGPTRFGIDEDTVLVPARIVQPRGVTDVTDRLGAALAHASGGVALDTGQRALVRDALTTAPNAHDKAILAAVDALDSGRQVIELSEVAAKMGAKRFAIGPAHASTKNVTRIWDRATGTIRFARGRWSMSFPGLHNHESYAFLERHRRVEGLIPYIPPMCRIQPLKGKLIVWEHAWKDERSERIRMHLDPALIEHVVGDLYVVLTTWDLTPLERAALGG